MTEFVLERKRVRGQYLDYVSSFPHQGRQASHTYTATSDISTAQKFMTSDEALRFMHEHDFERTFNCVEVF